MVMLYQVPKYGGADGRTVVREHFGGSAWPLDNIGIDTNATIYVGIVALAVNLLVAVVVTPLLRNAGAPDGRDDTVEHDYVADEGDPTVRRMTEILDGDPVPDAPPVPTSYFTPVGQRQPPAPAPDDTSRRAYPRL
jgi:SSS family solute:Na+ symporter